MFSKALLSEVLKPIDRGMFKKLVLEHGSDRYGKSFKSWQHVTAMLYCQFSGVSSLREAEIGYNSQCGVQHHVGLAQLKRSTLSQANNRRNPDFFKSVAEHVVGLCQPLQKEAASILRVIDASPIQVRGRGNQWTKATRCARIDGLKLHVSLSPEAGAMAYASITDARVNDVTEALNMPLEAGKIYIFDKGYCDYNWWKAIADKGGVFVTRLKRNAAFKVIKTHEIRAEDKGFILKDETIILCNASPRGGKKNRLAGVHLRRIEVAREGKEPLVLACNDLGKAADILAGYYKKRWSVELFFKWMKRYLKVKTFLGESKNSIKIQLYAAIIAYALMWLWKKASGRATLSITATRIFIQTKLFARLATEETLKKRRQTLAIHTHQIPLPL